MLRIVHDTDRAAAEVEPLDLDELCRIAAREMLAIALEAERRACLDAHADALDATGHRLVVGNGAARPREVMTGAGMVPVTAPRVDDRRAGEHFRSSLLPPYARRSPKVSEVLPILYLRGLGTGGFAPALADFFGADAGLSASTIGRLTVAWRAEHERWMGRDLSAVDYVYRWVDGIHFRIRLEEDRPCRLVIVGVRPDGSKEPVALADGYRESTESWAELLRDLRSRGLTAPVLATADGALGLWAALRDVFPETVEQRSSVHTHARDRPVPTRPGGERPGSDDRSRSRGRPAPPPGGEAHTGPREMCRGAPNDERPGRATPERDPERSRRIVDMDVFIGIDWGEQHHQVHALDADGGTRLEFRVDHDVAGLERLRDALSALGEPDSVGVAIERREGLLVEHLLAWGHPVYPVNPKVAARAREGYHAAPIKSDALDAFALADLLLTPGGGVATAAAADRDPRRAAGARA